MVLKERKLLVLVNVLWSVLLVTEEINKLERGVVLAFCLEHCFASSFFEKLLTLNAKRLIMLKY